MHADAKTYRLVPSTTDVFRSDSVLNRYRAGNGVDRAGKIGDHTVAGGVENAAAMGCDQTVDDDPTRLEPDKRAHFVVRHQPAVPGNVGREDSCELAFDWLNSHARLLPERV